MSDDPRRDPQPSADERTTLLEFLDWYRLTIEVKCDGMDEAQARRTVPPSDMSLLGLVRHLTEVERNWFRAKMAGQDAPYWFDYADDEDADWHPDDEETLAAALDRYRAECERSRAITASIPSLDTQSKVIVRGYDAPVSLRWVLVHMIEETARHAGHADLLRQSIDGATGD
jgi:uncharacterized damage-inducible protein DinB